MTVQDIDYENEMELLYAVVTQPGAGETVEAHMHFIDDDTGSTKRLVSLSEWNDVNEYSSYVGIYTYRLSMLWLHIMELVTVNGERFAGINFYRFHPIKFFMGNFFIVVPYV